MYQITRSQWDKLKDSEGSGYKQVDINVIEGSAGRKCVTLVAVQSIEGLAPSRQYLQQILDGAQEHGLSEGYMAEIVAKAGGLNAES